MADDLYSYLIGSAPTDKQKQAEIASQLRRRRSFGELGALTGDRVLQPFGAQMSQKADEYAGMLQNTRQKDVDNAQQERYQAGQLDHMKEVERLQERGQNLDHLYQMLMAQAALNRADKAGPKPSRLTYSDRNKLEQMSGMIRDADETLDTFNDKYAQQFGPGPQSKLPNFMSSIGLSTDNMDEGANWWAKWNLIYSLPQRNATFGATLTPTERQAWAESDINPSMDPKTIKSRAGKVVEILKRKGAMMNRTYQNQFDPELISDYDLPGEEYLQPPAGGHGPLPSRGTAPAAPKRVKVDAKGDPIGN